MIRKQIIFKTDNEVSLPYNYQLEVLRNIYKYISGVNQIKARQLHNEGYRTESGHRFKLFNFTLLFENAEFNDTIHCNSNTIIKLLISGKKDILNLIIKGLLNLRELNVGDNTLSLVSINDDKRVDFANIMLYNTFSPVITSTKTDNSKVEYLTIYDKDYFKNLANNSQRKYKLMYGKEYEDEIYFEIDDIFDVKDKFIQIKKGGLKGSEYNVWIEATKEMQKIIYYLGLGQNNSIGCGCLNFIKGVNSNV